MTILFSNLSILSNQFVILSLGQLIKDEIDIAAADFTVTFNRSQVVDFLPTLVQSWIQIFIQNPSASRNWLVFIEPITWQAWMIILVFFTCVPPIICSIFFYGNKRINQFWIFNILILILVIKTNKLFKFDLGKEDLKDEFRLSNCYVFAYKALLFHGWNYTPTFLQNRIAFITVVITAMICYWHWEAMIISYLAVRKIILPYESFEQLLTKSNDKVRVKTNRSQVICAFTYTYMIKVFIFTVRILQINLQMSFIQIKVLTLKGVLYGDMFRYAKDPILRRVYDERMKDDFDNFPEVALSFDLLSLVILEHIKEKFPIKPMKYEVLLYFQSDDQLLAKILEGGYAVFDSASGWKTKPEYLDCLIVDLPIAYSEQVC